MSQEDSEMSIQLEPEDDFTMAPTVGKKKRRRFLRADEADKWHEHFQVLVAFKNKYNHTLVPHTYPSNPALGRWVKRQRYQHKQLQLGKESSMLQDRLELLENIGFVWDSHEATWKEKLEELTKYKEIHGNCDVPYYFPLNPQLATWTTRQRRQYTLYNQKKKSSMTPGRIALLENLGFRWNTRVSRSIEKTSHEETKLDQEQTSSPQTPIIQSAAHHIEGPIEAISSTLEKTNETKYLPQEPTKCLDKIMTKGLKAVDHVPFSLGNLPLSGPDCGKFSDADGRMFLEVLDDLSSDGESETYSKPSKKAHLDLDADDFSYHEGLLSSVLSDISIDEDDNDDDDTSKEFNTSWSKTFDSDFLIGM